MAGAETKNTGMIANCELNEHDDIAKCCWNWYRKRFNSS